MTGESGVFSVGLKHIRLHGPRRFACLAQCNFFNITCFTHVMFSIHVCKTNCILSLVLKTSAMELGNIAQWRGHFLFRAQETHGFSLARLYWDPAPARLSKSGLGGRVRCVGALPEVSGYPSSDVSFRIHVCAHTPCTADYHPSKYGRTEPPFKHGHVALLLEADEALDLEAKMIELGLMAKPSALVSPTSTGHGDAPAPSVTVASTGHGDAPAPASLGCLPPLPPPVFPPPGDALRDAILRHAEIMKRMGQYLGLFDILLFCSIQKRRLYFLYGDNEMDVVTALAPGIMDASWFLPAFEHRIVACIASDSGLAPVSERNNLSRVNHYVAALPMGDPLPGNGEALSAQLARKGYCCIETVVNGDCCPDSFAIAAGVVRSAPARQKIRHEIYEHCIQVAGRDVWQEAFRVCQERNDEVPEPEPVALPQPPSLPPTNKISEVADPEPVALPQISEVADTEPVALPQPPSLPHTNKISDVADELLLKVVSWSTGLPSPTPAMLRRLCASISNEQAQDLLTAYEENQTSHPGCSTGRNLHRSKKNPNGSWLQLDGIP